MNTNNIRGIKFLSTILFLGLHVVLFAEGDGFGENPGGSKGDTVWVSTVSDLKKYAASEDPYVIMVSDTIDLGESGVKVSSNKTICGTDSTVLIKGPINIKGGVKNVVVKYLTITNPAGDGITIRDGTSYVYVEHCTLYDCADGSIDITVESDFVTIAYCRFYYVDVIHHQFVNLIGADDSNVTDLGKLHVTFHHNWWDVGGVCRMPLIRFGRVHMYNNYFGCFNNQYSSRARLEAQLYSEYNYYDHVNDPFSVEEGGKAKSVGNIYDECQGAIYDGQDSVFRPSYPYQLTSAQLAKDEVLASAGNRRRNPVQINNKKETVISWGNQSKIIYSTPLSEVQLCAKAEGNTSAPEYSPSPGSILPGGGINTITVTFPEDENYKKASKTVNIEVAWEYFSLSVLTTNNAKPELVVVSPDGTPINNLTKFIKGTVVTLTASSNAVSKFDHWSDGDNNPVKTIIINEDIQITAHYQPAGFIVGWDFNSPGNKSRIADFYSDEVNKSSTLELMHENGTLGSWVLISSENAVTWFGKYAAVIGKSRTLAGKYFFMFQCNAGDFENIRLSASMLGVYTFYQIQNVEYSTDGITYKTAGSIKLEQDSVWYTGEIALPVDADHAKTLYVRIKADNTSELTTNGNDGTSISEIYLYADHTGSGVASCLIPEGRPESVVERKYFTSDGRRISTPGSGVTIVATRYTDGTLKFRKIINKNY